MENNLFLMNLELEQKKKAIGIIHRVYLTQIKNSRVITASTKTKSEVRGGGRKPWRQKGTGNARAGSLRSPLFVGGGVIFGPKPRTCNRKINKKERQLSIFSALALKKNQCQIIDTNFFLENESLTTKRFVEKLTPLGINFNKKILLILPAQSTLLKKNIWQVSRNLKSFNVVAANCLSLQDILYANQILLLKSSLETLITLYGK